MGVIKVGSVEHGLGGGRVDREIRAVGAGDRAAIDGAASQADDKGACNQKNAMPKAHLGFFIRKL
jgi:hypothetical protein